MHQKHKENHTMVQRNHIVQSSKENIVFIATREEKDMHRGTKMRERMDFSLKTRKVCEHKDDGKISSKQLFLNGIQNHMSILKTQ